MRSIVLIAGVVWASSAQEVPILRSEVNLVRAAVSVADRDGQPVMDMRQEEFDLRDNGKARAIQYLWREADTPLVVGLVIDMSGSQSRYATEHARTVTQFLNKVMRPQDQAFLIAFAGNVKLVTDLTHSVAELQKGVEQLEGEQWWYSGKTMGNPCFGEDGRTRMRRRCGGSALWDSVHVAANLHKESLAGSRKALIVLSDGAEEGSEHSLNDAIEAAQSADLLVYTIRYPVGFPTPRGRRSLGTKIAKSVLSTKGRRGLQRVSEETGAAVFVYENDENARAFARIEEELRSLYVLGFTVPEEARDGKFHKLEVKSARGGVKLRSRPGYTAPR